MKIRVRSNERAAFVGKTGSGKTTLAKFLTRSIDRLVVFDPKGSLKPDDRPDWNLEPWTEDSARKLRDRSTHIRLHVPGPGPTDDDRTYWLPFMQWIWDSGNVTLYMDEAYGVVPFGSRPPNQLVALVTRGREKEIGVWTATQRPAWIPMILLSESEWLFAFQLLLAGDRNRLAEIGGPELSVPVVDEHGFYIFNAQWPRPIYVPRLLRRGAPSRQHDIGADNAEFGPDTDQA